MTIAKGGGSWILTSFLITFLCMIITVIMDGQVQWVFLAITLLLAVVCFLLLIFFRDPQREIGDGVVAVADGVIKEIVKQKDKDAGMCIKIVTFMNIHNVHVNRIPLDGKIHDISHHAGGHLPAFQKESEKNEQVRVLLTTADGMVKIVQIAGTLARRIVPYVKKGDVVKKGEKLGIIRLGSRVDIYLPSTMTTSIMVKVKDKIKAGEDTIAKIND